ncbi:NADPH-dependent FMN reductase, ArsH-like [Herminiimonas arsenicoxydans]|uniref:NADPH-dependent FMN reductase, ArsH-like, partial n=1 Tax=Herminiimonas arsenicoxydans TaxID=204773 RepID=A4G2K3_HERAR|nr:NADPH-dependent FMN reductase, ArsH-like [Herminiimonas arsenicoxydans]
MTSIKNERTWPMRIVTIRNQISVAKAFEEFDDSGRMQPSIYCGRLIDVMKELSKFTLLVRERSDS